MCVFNDLHWGMSGEWTWGHHHHSRVCEGFQCHDTLSNGYTERRANIFLNDWADTKYMCTWHIRMCNALLLWHSCSDARLSLTFFSLPIAFSFALCVSPGLWMISRFFCFFFSILHQTITHDGPFDTYPFISLYKALRLCMHTSHSGVFLCDCVWVSATKENA